MKMIIIMKNDNVMKILILMNVKVILILMKY